MGPRISSNESGVASRLGLFSAPGFSRLTVGRLAFPDVSANGPERRGAASSTLSSSDLYSRGTKSSCMKSSPSDVVNDSKLLEGCHARLITFAKSYRRRMFCVLVSQSRIWPSAPAVASSAPLGDQLRAVISPLWPPENDFCRLQSEAEKTTTSRVACADAKAVPSGCQTALDVASSSGSSRRITPSSFRTNSGSSETTE